MTHHVRLAAAAGAELSSEADAEAELSSEADARAELSSEADPAGGRRWCVTAHWAAAILERRKMPSRVGACKKFLAYKQRFPIRMPEFIYTMHNVRKTLGDKVVLDNVTLSFYPSAKIGVVGPNGTGKSTLLRVMAGIEKPNNGDATLAKDATVGILLQEPPLTEGKTVLENVEEGVADVKALQVRMDELGVAMGEPDADFDTLMAEMGEVQTELDRRNAWDIDSQLEQAMDALRCPPPDAMVDVLSGGERRRVALCKLLLQQPDLLLLDEPTNHLDAESVQWLESHLKAYPGAVLAVTHDRYFLDNVAQWILELDRGRTHPYEGNYSTYLDTKKARLQIEGRRDAKRAKILERELEWARSNPKARQAKNRARLVRYEELRSEAERSRKLDFEEINIPPGPRLGSTVLDAKQLVKGYGDRRLFDGLSSHFRGPASSAWSDRTGSGSRRSSA